MYDRMGKSTSISVHQEVKVAHGICKAVLYYEKGLEGAMSHGPAAEREAAVEAGAATETGAAA